MDHDERVQAVCEQVKARPASQKITLRKKRPGHTPHDYGYKAGKHVVDLTQLDHVLSLDREQRLVICEGEVNMGQLCKATMPYGFVPAVVPELETFTVGGLIGGLGIETSAHRYGIFPMNVPWFDAVLGNGEVVRCDEQQNAELFRALPGSYGTLGLVTRAAVQLVPCKPFVCSRYYHFAKASDYVAAFARALDEHHFVEGMVMGPDSHVLVAGDMSDARPGLDTYHAMKSGNLWYYEHAAKQARHHREDLVPTYEYLFRHMRSLLWVSRFANFLHLPMTRLGRYLLDERVMNELLRFGLTSAIPTEARERSVVMQDVAVSLERLEEGIAYAKQHFGVYPFWNCAAGHPQRGPYVEGRGNAMHFIVDHRLSAEERQVIEQRTRYMVDIGLYGEPTVSNFRHRSAIRALQSFANMPAMWGVCYLDREDFRRLYGIEAYEALRPKYHADAAFSHIEEKVLNQASSQLELAPRPLWRAQAMLHRVRNPGRGL